LFLVPPRNPTHQFLESSGLRLHELRIRQAAGMTHRHQQRCDRRDQPVVILSVSWRQQSGEDRWQNVVLAFLQSARNVDLTRRRVGLAQKLANDTVHHLNRFCRQFEMRDRQQGAVRNCDPGILENVQARKSESVEARDLRESLVRRVLEMAEQDIISEWAAEVLIATRLEGRRLKDLPGKGCSYETAKKRRQREEAKLVRAVPIWERVMSIA